MEQDIKDLSQNTATRIALSNEVAAYANVQTLNEVLFD